MHAFVPIKSHSERVAGKNFKLLGDKPLYMWIMEVLLSLDSISAITIDTDSEDLDLWNLVSNPKINIKKRKKELLGDFTSMNDIIWDYVKTSNHEDFFMTHTTNPFLSKSTIEKAIETYNQKKTMGYDSLCSVSIIQGRLYSPTGFPINHTPSKLVRTQDLEPIFLENSCFYIFNKATFVLSRARIGSCPYYFATPALESIDIDTEDDWHLAERVAKGMIAD